VNGRRSLGNVWHLLSFDQTGNVPLPLAAIVLALGNFLLIAAVFYCIWRLMDVYLTVGP
jgi:hypothetical protein